MKYVEICAFLDLYFPVYGQNCICIFLYLDRIRDSFQIQENTGMILPTYSKKLRSEKPCILTYFMQKENRSWMLANKAGV